MYLFKGYVDREQIDGDVDRLTAYYRSFGYFQAKVGRKLEYNEKGQLGHAAFRRPRRAPLPGPQRHVHRQQDFRQHVADDGARSCRPARCSSRPR